MKRFLCMFLVMGMLTMSLGVSVSAETNLKLQQTTEDNIEYIVATSNTKLLMVFSTQVDKDIVEDISNYSISVYDGPIGDVNVFNVEYNSSDNTAIVTTSKMTVGTVYEMKIDSITNGCLFAGVKQESNHGVKFIETLSNNKVKIAFNETVKLDLAEDISNYYIHKYYKEGIIKVEDAKYNLIDNTVILTIDTLEQDVLYEIEIFNIYSEGTVKGLIMGMTITPTIKVDYAAAISNTKIKVFFEGVIDKNIAENISNYKIETISENTPIEILNARYNSDDNTVILTSEKLKVGKVYNLIISNLCSKETATVLFAGR